MVCTSTLRSKACVPDAALAMDFDEALARLSGAGPAALRIEARMLDDFSLAVSEVKAWRDNTLPSEQAALKRLLVIATLQGRFGRTTDQAATAL